MQAVTDETKRPVSLFRVVAAFIFFNKRLLPIERLDKGEIDAMIGEVLCPFRLVPFIDPYLIVPPNKSMSNVANEGCQRRGGRYDVEKLCRYTFP